MAKNLKNVFNLAASQDPQGSVQAEQPAASSEMESVINTPQDGGTIQTPDTTYPLPSRGVYPQPDQRDMVPNTPYPFPRGKDIDPGIVRPSYPHPLPINVDPGTTIPNYPGYPGIFDPEVPFNPNLPNGGFGDPGFKPWERTWPPETIPTGVWPTETTTVSFDDAKTDITRMAVEDDLARDAINSVGHEMDVSAFQNYVHQMEAYEKQMAEYQALLADGKNPAEYMSSLTNCPTAPNGYSDVYAKAYQDYKLRKEALTAYLNPEDTSAYVLGSDNPYMSEAGMSDIAARWETAEKAVTELAACGDDTMPPQNLLDQRNAMGRYAEWGDAYDAMQRYCHGNRAIGYEKSIDCTGVEIDPERKAQIQAQCPVQSYIGRGNIPIKEITQMTPEEQEQIKKQIQEMAKSAAEETQIAGKMDSGTYGAGYDTAAAESVINTDDLKPASPFSGIVTQAKIGPKESSVQARDPSSSTRYTAAAKALNLTDLQPDGPLSGPVTQTQIESKKSEGRYNDALRALGLTDPQSPDSEGPTGPSTI